MSDGLICDICFKLICIDENQIKTERMAITQWREVEDKTNGVSHGWIELDICKACASARGIWRLK